MEGESGRLVNAQRNNGKLYGVVTIENNFHSINKSNMMTSNPLKDADTFS